MPYDSQTTAAGLGRLIPENVATEILKNVPQESAVAATFRKTTLSTRTTRQNVLAALPMAYWVSSDTGMKQTTMLEWDSKVFEVQELATIVPIPINVLDDASFDFWAEVRPLVAEAIGRALDAAIFFGINKPVVWPDSILAQAVAAANVVDVDSLTSDAAMVDAISDTMTTVEDDGFDVNGFIVPRSFRGTLRKLRNANGDKLADIAGNTYEGVSLNYAMDGMWPAIPAAGAGSAVRLFAGDWSKAILATRKDITYEIFREGVITDNATPPQIIYNLMQQDMVAMRVTARYAFQTANPINYSQVVEANRSPFGVLRVTPPI